jgi:hypothetical protein
MVQDIIKTRLFGIIMEILTMNLMLLVQIAVLVVVVIMEAAEDLDMPGLKLAAADLDI